MTEERKRNFLARCGALGAVMEKMERHFIAAMTLAFGAILLYNLILRALNIQGLTWIEEFSRYMLVITTLIGCSIAAKHKGHMVMDTLVTALPTRIGQMLQGFGYLICAIMYLYLGYYAWRWTGRLIAMGKEVESVHFPLWPIWVFTTYAIITMGLRYLVQTGNSAMAAYQGESIVSEQDAEIARALAEEEQRQRAMTGPGNKGNGL